MESSQVFSLSLLQELAWENVNKTQDMNVALPVHGLGDWRGVESRLHPSQGEWLQAGTATCLPQACHLGEGGK